MAGHGRYGTSWRSLVRRGGVWQGRYGLAGLVGARQGRARQAWRGMAKHGLVRYGMARIRSSLAHQRLLTRIQNPVTGVEYEARALFLDALSRGPRTVTYLHRLTGRPATSRRVTLTVLSNMWEEGLVQRTRTRDCSWLYRLSS